MLIPEFGAGYSRVTHPFATDQKEQAPSSPFDLHVLSTPPAFVLSQDQTLRKCLIARQPKSPAHYVQHPTGIGESTASLKLTEQIITDLLCCLNVFQRNPRPDQKDQADGYLAFDIVHAVEFSRIGCSCFSPYRAAPQGNFSNLPLSKFLSNRGFFRLRLKVGAPKPSPEFLQLVRVEVLYPKAVNADTQERLFFYLGLVPHEAGELFRSAAPLG